MTTGKLVRHALVALVAIGSTALACEMAHATGCASECDLPTKWSQFTQLDGPSWAGLGSPGASGWAFWRKVWVASQMRTATVQHRKYLITTRKSRMREPVFAL